MGLLNRVTGRAGDESQPVADHTATGQPRWQAIPAARSSLPILQIKMWVVTGGLLFAAAMGLFAGLSNLGADPVDVDVPPQPQAKAFATQIADDFLAGRKTALPVAEDVNDDFTQPQPDDEDARRPRLGARNVTWAGFEPASFAASVTSAAQTYEVHTFDLFVGDTAHELTVTVATDGPALRLAAAPSLSPVVLAADGGDGVTWPGRASAYERTPGPVATRVRQWAQAYAADDRDDLKDVTGDNRVGATYVGLGGWSTDPDQVRVERIVAADGDDDLVWVRARVPLIRANGWVHRSDYDLLVGNHDTDRPTVLAWGPAGTAHELAPLTNAVLTRPNSSQEPTEP